MSEITFIHLSDIHFRKTSGSSTDIDEDLRNAILTDIQYNAKKRLKNIKGVLVGGDIAFAGKREEYDIAKKFLGTLTSYLEPKIPTNYTQVYDEISTNKQFISDILQK